MKKKSKNKLVAKAPKAVKAPLESPGSYYLRVRESGSWAVMLETYMSGKRKQRTIQESMYPRLGFLKTMTVDQARVRVRELNVLDKKEQAHYKAMILASKRAQKMEEADRIYFPEELLALFVTKIEKKPGLKPKYRNRLLRCFEVVTEMIPRHVKAMPFQYNTEADQIISYFCSKKYSVSYSSDIIMVLNMWARHYSTYKGTYADVIGKMTTGYREAIEEAHSSKEQVVRKSAIPITRDEIEFLWSRIDKSNEEQVANFLWIRSSWLFGLRPSELDRCINTEDKEDLTTFVGGVRCLLAVQTKTVNKEGVRLKTKKIPVLSEEQDEALNDILTKPMKRPTVEFMNENLRVKGKKYKGYEGRKFDCYSGRKGFIDLMLKEPYNQILENVSVYLGHSSITTSYTHYKDKVDLHITPTEFTAKTKKPKIIKSA